MQPNETAPENPTPHPPSVSSILQGQTETDLLLQSVRLSLITGIGPRMIQNLLARFETIPQVFNASEAELLAVPGVGPKIVAKILAPDTLPRAEQELERLQQSKLKLYLNETAAYPPLLSEICDAPQLLYCRGEILPQDNLAVAIVGSRRCTPYGINQARMLAGALARAGITIISGLARGIDAAAHQGALDAGGRTLSVFATGLGTIYPPEHLELAEAIALNGALLTESHFEQKPFAGLFPQRNRIISGLSLGVILIEASRKSGSLHTARHAMEQGREVFALPGRVDSLPSQGCLDLIRDGATLIRNVEDVFEELGPLINPVKTDSDTEIRTPRELNLNEQETLVLNSLSTEPQHIDDILRDTTLETSQVLSTLTVLEMKQLVRRFPGNHLARI